MNFPHPGPLRISIEKQGAKHHVKQSFPLRFGTYSEIRANGFEFCFNLNGEVKSIRGLKPDWPHPSEQFKRTVGNDWVYHTVGDKGGDGGIKSWTGEYYLPCLPYKSNPVWEVNYFSNPVVMAALAQWSQLFADLYMARSKGMYPHAAQLFDRILANDDQVLHNRANALNDILGRRVSVLPPDTRHVDYEVIPLIIADGCRYQCKFCCVKSGISFEKRSRQSILEQVAALKTHFGEDIVNYHALFLGDHDALGAGGDLIRFAARTAYDGLGFRERSGRRPFLYLFGSVGALLAADWATFAQLNALPFYTYINVGFESTDPATLEEIGKPVTADRVTAGFQKMLAVNAEFDHIEITGNFIAGQDLARRHYESCAHLLATAQTGNTRKGTVYLSPLKDSPKKRQLLPLFFNLKEHSRLPLLVYLIQRL